MHDPVFPMQVSNEVRQGPTGNESPFCDIEKSTCIAACGNHKYAGMEDDNLCFCGDILPAATLKRPGECTTPCPGDTSEMCGGHLRISIFDVPGKFTVLLYIMKLKIIKDKLQDFNTFS